MASKDEVAVKLRLERGAQFKTGMNQASASVRKLGKDARWSAAGLKMAKNSMDSMRGGASFITHGLARGVQGAGLAMGAFGLLTVKTGLQFNATMQQNQIAFTKFLGSGEKANAFLGDLFQLAKETPFEFTQLTSASQKLLAFGFSAKQTKRTLKDLADVASGMGKSGEDIDRMVLAIGQIQAKGKLQGDEMLQLTESGIPALQVISKAIGKSTTETSKMITKGEVSSKTAIDAILAYSEKKFGGMSAKQSKTLTGQWSTLKDNFAQLSGAMTSDLTNPLTKGMSTANTELSKITAVFKRKDWDFSRKLQVTRHMAARFLAPLVEEGKASIEKMHLGRRLSDAVDTYAPIVADKFAQMAPMAAGRFIHAFMAAGAWTKFLTVGWLLHKMGAFSAVGSVVAKRFAARFLATAGAEVAAGGALTAAAPGLGAAMAAPFAAAFWPVVAAAGLVALVDHFASNAPGKRAESGNPEDVRSHHVIKPGDGPTGAQIYHRRTGDYSDVVAANNKAAHGNPGIPQPAPRGGGRGSSVHVYVDSSEVGARVVKRGRDRARRR